MWYTSPLLHAQRAFRHLSDSRTSTGWLTHSPLRHAVRSMGQHTAGYPCASKFTSGTATDYAEHPSDGTSRNCSTTSSRNPRLPREHPAARKRQHRKCTPFIQKTKPKHARKIIQKTPKGETRRSPSTTRPEAGSALGRANQQASLGSRRSHISR